jgi:hypothetical protein
MIELQQKELAHMLVFSAPANNKVVKIACFSSEVVS